MPTEPQPRIDKDGVPICDPKCVHFRGHIGESADCLYTGEPTDLCVPCLPAVRAMAAELQQLKQPPRQYTTEPLTIEDDQ